MDKAQAVHDFWSKFGIPAYDENSVPDDATMPYVTYNVTTDNFDKPVQLNGSLWYRSTSWEDVSKKTDEISRHVGYGYYIQKIDGGYMRIVMGQPFAQRMNDPEDAMVRRMFIILEAEFMTAD